MGCGNSKLAPEGEVVPPRIRPLLRRRFLEMRKGRNANVLKDGGLSKKNLLKDGEDEDDSHSSPPHSEIVDSKSTSSSTSSSPEKKVKLQGKPEPTEKSIKDLKEQNNKEAESADDKKIVDITGSSKKEDKENVQGGEKDKPHTGGESKEKEVKGQKEEEEDDDDDDEDEDSTDDEDDRFICPGSPSFRVYFLDAAENEKKKLVEEEEEEEEEEEREEDDSPKKKKSQSNDSFGSNESAASNMGEERKRSKKGKRGRAFRRAIKKGGPVAVKNLLNVKSCYQPGCASGHDRATLLEGKAAAA